VTAPATTDGTVETPKDTTTRPAGSEKKSSFLGSFMKKPEAKKEETTDAKVAEPATVEPTAATTTPAEATKTDTEAAVKDDKAPAEKEKRRTSLFGGLGTIKKKKDESEVTENGTERKREKSPLPSKIGGLFRKPSKAVKSEEPKTTETKDETKTETPATETTSTEPVVASTTEPKTDAAVTTDATDSKIIGDVVPETLQAQDKVATAPEVKATA
jgi:hypothetical protein